MHCGGRAVFSPGEGLHLFPALSWFSSSSPRSFPEEPESSRECNSGCYVRAVDGEREIAAVEGDFETESGPRGSDLIMPDCFLAILTQAEERRKIEKSSKTGEHGKEVGGVWPCKDRLRQFFLAKLLLPWG